MSVNPLNALHQSATHPAIDLTTSDTEPIPTAEESFIGTTQKSTSISEQHLALPSSKRRRTTDHQHDEHIRSEEHSSEENYRQERDLIKNEWQEYRCKFAGQYLSFNQENNDRIDWSDFKQRLRDYFSKMLACCKKHDRHINDKLLREMYRLDGEIHRLEGALKHMDGDLKGAIRSYVKAIFLNPHVLPSWLFLASALFSSKRYQDVRDLAQVYFRQIEHKSLMHERLIRTFMGGDIDAIFSFYRYFSFLSDDCIEANCLQLTHPGYINTEMYYYLAKAKQAINPQGHSLFGEVFARRAIECTMFGWFDQGEMNFLKAREVSSKILFGDWYSYCLFMNGKTQEAIDEMKHAIDTETDDEKKIKRSFRLIEYYFSSEHEGDAYDQLERLDLAKLSEIDHLQRCYYKAKAKFALKNPSIQTFLDLTKQFFAHYNEIPVEQREHAADQWLENFVQLGNDFCHYCLEHDQVHGISKIHECFIDMYEELIQQLEKTLIPNSESEQEETFIPNSKLEQDAYFPNWIYDRIYLKYFISLVLQCIIFSGNNRRVSSENGNLKLTLRYRKVVADIQEKLKLFRERWEVMDPDESGIPFKCKILRGLIEIATDSVSPDSSEESIPAYAYFQRIIQQYAGEAPDVQRNLIETATDSVSPNSSEESIPGYAYFYPIIQQINDADEVPDVQRIYDSRLEQLKKLADKKKLSLQSHVSDVCEDLQLGQWGSLARISQPPQFTDREECEKHFSLMFRTIHGWLSRLEAYDAVIKKEQNKALKNLHSNKLNDHRLQFFPDVAETLLRCRNDLKEAGCDKLFRQAVEYSQKFLTPLRTLISDRFPENQKEYYSYLFAELETAIQEAETIESQRKISEIKAQNPPHPIDLFYGDTYRVKFPHAQMTASLHGLKESAHLDPKKNLSAHFFTIIYKDPNAKMLRTAHVKQRPERKFFTQDMLPNASQAFIARIQRGYDIFKQMPEADKPLLTIEESEVQLDYKAYAHLHSEQAGFEWTDRNIENMTEHICKSIPQRSKIYMIAFDIGSLYSSCTNCRLAALSMQSRQGNFLPKLEQHLNNQGYILPKNGLKTVTRVLFQDQLFKQKKHVNPDVKDVKRLNNYGFFQYRIHNVFASGSKRNLKSY